MSVVSTEKDLDGLSLLLVAEFDAPIERVWQLWADPRQLERWWGLPTHPAPAEEHDQTVGGEVSYFMPGPGGEQSRGWWRVSSVNPPRWLEFTDGFAREDGTPNAEMPTTEVQVRLLERGSGTRMELGFVFASREHMEQLERWGAFEVFPQSVGQMDALLSATGKATAAKDQRLNHPMSIATSTRERSHTARRPTRAQDQVELLHLPRWRRRGARQVALPISTMNWEPPPAPISPPPTRC
jgi:uncharacterized protein YndB with AHSA1/START domain